MLDTALCTRSNPWVNDLVRTVLDINLAKAGNWVLLEGVDASIHKTATICDAEEGGLGGGEDAAIFRPLSFKTSSVSDVMHKLSCLHPFELKRTAWAASRAVREMK